jgi:hypothetical protein
MGYTGRCACGNVKLSITGEPVATRQCWCRQCQHLSGGGPSHNCMFRTDEVHLDGQLGAHSYVADSGNTLTQWFCPGCGNHIYAQSSARPQLRTVRLGVLDQPHGLAPRMAIWTAAAPPWAAIDPALEQHPGQPPAPPGSK